MDGVYTGDDRIEQVIYLQNLAANISHGSDDPSISARDRVNYYCAHFPEELPPWFDDHDRELVIGLVEPDEEDLDDGEPCYGRTWRTCWRHPEYPRGECPICDQDLDSGGRK